MKVTSIENAEHYNWGDNCDGWHLARSEQLSVIEERVLPGCFEVRHYHQHAEQFFYVLSGQARLEVEGTLYALHAGEGMHVPAGVKHQLSNQTQEDVRFLVISTPPSHGDRVIE